MTTDATRLAHYIYANHNQNDKKLFTIITKQKKKSMLRL